MKDEIQMRAAAVKAGIDMRKTNIDQRFGLVNFGGSDNGFHCKLNRFAELAVKPLLIELSELQVTDA